jgi:hypothetical protein
MWLVDGIRRETIDNMPARVLVEVMYLDTGVGRENTKRSAKGRVGHVARSRPGDSSEP